MQQARNMLRLLFAHAVLMSFWFCRTAESCAVAETPAKESFESSILDSSLVFLAYLFQPEIHLFHFYWILKMDPFPDPFIRFEVGAAGSSLNTTIENRQQKYKTMV